MHIVDYVDIMFPDKYLWTKEKTDDTFKKMYEDLKSLSKSCKGKVIIVDSINLSKEK